MRAPLLLSLVAVSLALAAACGIEDEVPPNRIGSSASGAGTGGEAGTGGAGGGASGAGGVKAEGRCYPSDPKCGLLGSKCMAIVDCSAEAVKWLRLAQLQITTPPTLANTLIQGTIVNPAIAMRNDKDCNLASPRAGLFNWLFEIDTANNTMKTGGGSPQPNPDGGYCFVTTQVGSVTVQPANVAISYDAATSSVTAGDTIDLAVPVFDEKDLEGTPIILPLRGVTIDSFSLDENGNCVGRFKGGDEELDEDCAALSASNPKSDDYYLYVNGGLLSGHILVAEADEVFIDDVGRSLCAVMTQQSTKKYCKDSEPFYPAEGANAPDLDTDGDGTNDAFTVSAMFAASSVTITGDCP